MDLINKPQHYTQHKIECIEIVERLPFGIGSVIKYLWRYDAKGTPEQDLRKALFYCDRFTADKRRGGFDMLPDLYSQIELTSKIAEVWPLGEWRGEAMALALCGDTKNAAALIRHGLRMMGVEP